MCKCTPEMRTPFCGKPGCEWPTLGATAQIIGVLEEMKQARTEMAVIRLEAVLDQAKRGEICAFAIATVGPDLATGSAFSLGDKTLTEVIGSIELMKHRIMTDAESGALD